MSKFIIIISVCIDSALAHGSLAAFIGKFNYNMMEENFVERKLDTGAKFLAAFGMKYIRASITHHGIGTIALVVNVAHNLLEKVR